MKRAIASKVYKSLRNGLKIGYDKILYYRTYDEYERANKGINDVFNSKLECVCFVSYDVADKLVERGLVEFKKTKIGDCCCVLTNDNNLIEQDIINYFNGDLEDDDEILDERAVLTIAAIVLNNPLHNEKHLAEILESFSIVGEYEISFVHLGIVMGFISMYKDEVEECENLTEEDADYIIDIDGIKFYIFNT